MKERQLRKKSGFPKNPKMSITYDEMRRIMGDVVHGVFGTVDGIKLSVLLGKLVQKP